MEATTGMHEPEGISFQGRLSPGDFRKIQAVATRPLQLVYGGAFVLMIVMLLRGHFHSPLAMALAWAPVPILILGTWMAWRFMFRQGWTQNKIIQQSFSGTVSENGIHWRSDTSELNMPWNMFHKARLANDLVLIYTSPRQALFFPRSFFASDRDWEQFRERVRRQLPRRRAR